MLHWSVVTVWRFLSSGHYCLIFLAALECRWTKAAYCWKYCRFSWKEVVALPWSLVAIASFLAAAVRHLLPHHERPRLLPLRRSSPPSLCQTLPSAVAAVTYRLLLSKGEACLVIAFLPRKGDPLLPMCCFRYLLLLAGSDLLEALEPCGRAALWILTSTAGVLPPALPLTTLPMSVRREARTSRSLGATCCVKRIALTHTSSALFQSWDITNVPCRSLAGDRRLHHCHSSTSSSSSTASDALKLLPLPLKEEVPEEERPLPVAVKLQLSVALLRREARGLHPSGARRRRCVSACEYSQDREPDPTCSPPI